MRLYSFRGTRYRSVDPEAVAAPPFDQIDSARQTELHAAHPRHFAHLTRPHAPAEAARQLESWREEGVVGDDGSPRLYAYAIDLADGRRRLGLCGLIGIEKPGDDIIRPHESTVDKTIDERLTLLEATRSDLEPILMMCEPNPEFEALLEQAAGQGEPLAAHTDDLGHVHRLFAIDDPTVCDRFKQILALSPGWIADGHHRYRVASEFARRHQPAPGSAAAAKLAVVTSLGSPGLTIDPIHRSLAVPIHLDAAGDAIAGRASWPGDGGAELATAVAAAPQPAIGVRVAGSDPEIVWLDPASAPADLPPSAAPLAAALLHLTLFDRLGLPPTASTDGTVAYRSDPEQLWREIDEGTAATGIWLPPTSPELFTGAAAARDRLPPKWTRFAPKLVSGLVWCGHDAEVA